MIHSGPIRKMRVQYHVEDTTVSYFLRLGEHEIYLNEFLGKEISLIYNGRIFCKNCGKKTNKSFAQGFCYPCFMNAPENAECILHPELCKGHEGGGRDPEWEQAHHVQPHLVYLAYSTEVKVGVTRSTQGITRWIDQGAEAVVVLAEVPYRQLAGEIEVFLKDYFTDKTNWQKMLKNQIPPNLDELRSALSNAEQYLPEIYQEYFTLEEKLYSIHYPQIGIPDKVSSTNFEKTPELNGTLIGIKGQYLIFEDQRVINIRSMEGYDVTWIE
jgi:hypothetical protein